MNLKVGQLFGNDFEIIKKIGEGGFGAVFLVKQRSTNRLRALKLLRLDKLPRDKEPRERLYKRLRERFEVEIKIGANIDSEHIAEVIAAGYDEPSRSPWLAMEFLNGQDLFEYLSPNRYLHLEDALEILRQVCDALGAAHLNGIIHRDLKPENVFLAKKPENPLLAPFAKKRSAPFTVKLLDFGIAKVVAEFSSGSGETEEETVTVGVGTPYWMAPEQVHGRYRITPATDVWALGLLAFRMIFGHMFWPDNIGDIFVAMLRERHPLATERAAELECQQWVPTGFDAWFSMCVANNPEDRYTSAVIAFRELERIFSASGLPSEPRAQGVDPIAPAMPSPEMTRHRTTSPENQPFLSRNAVPLERSITQPFLLRPKLSSQLQQETSEPTTSDDNAVEIVDDEIEMVDDVVEEAEFDFKPDVSAEVIRHFASRLPDLDHEEFWIASLDEHNAMQWARELQGGAHGGAVPPKDILRMAISGGASSLILVHNHPTTDPTPTEEDMVMTQTLAEAARVVGVPLVDHVIMGRQQYVSMLEMGVLACPREHR